MAQKTTDIQCMGAKVVVDVQAEIYIETLATVTGNW
jgi:hypothetical protein